MSKFLRHFPTNDFLLDTMIAFLYDEVQANEEIMDMLDKKLTEYLKSKYLIPLGKYKGNDNLNPFYDRHMRILHRLGIREDKVYKKILNSEYVQDRINSFVSPLHKFTAENTFLKSIIIQYSVLELIKAAKSPTPTSSGGLPEAPQGAFDTCAPERRVSQALLLATAKKRLLHYLLFLTLLTVLQCTS